LETGIDGSWLLAVVATQTISVYLSLITLIIDRLAFVKLTPAELTPPYWINMGAARLRRHQVHPSARVSRGLPSLSSGLIGSV